MVGATPRRNINAIRGGNAHPHGRKKNTRREMGKAYLTPFSVHPRKRRNDLWAVAP